jgi:tetratricopeptide (TPR) repeat protein
MYKAVAGLLSTLFLSMLSAQACANLDEVAAQIEANNYQNALKSLSSQPVSRRSRLLRANALAGLKRNDEAEAIYRALIDEAPEDPTPYNNLATLYAASGLLQEASELLTRGMKSDERYAAIYKNLSRVYVEMSRNSYARALRMNEKQQGLKLVTLDHRDGPSEPLQVAAVALPQPEVTTTPAPAKVAQAVPKSALKPEPVEAAALAKSAAKAEQAPPSTPSVAPVPRPAKPVAVAQVTSPKNAVEFDAGGAIAALKQWAAAWSANDVEAYLAAYDDEFLPPRDLTRAQWQAERRVRLKKPKKIEVMLSDFEVSSTSDSSLTVKLLQRYRSNSYRDTTRKGFILVRRNGKWKIGDEYTIEVIN